MTRFSRSCIALALASALLGPPARGAAPNQAALRVEAEAASTQWRFQLLPQALSPHPVLNMTVITEMTEEGRKREPATLDHPAYYAAYSAGYRELGDDTSALSPGSSLVEESMKHALAHNGFLPAARDHAPTLLLVYHWGVYGASYSVQPTDQMQVLVQRASLVGGTKFADELYKAEVNQIKEFQLASIMPQNDAALYALAGFRPPFFEPWNRFKDRDRRTAFLAEQSLDPIYFVLVSAYDYSQALRKQKVLLWQTKMTANWGTLSLAETLPTLIARSGRYLGREMDAAATIMQKVNRDATAKIGETRFIGFEPPGPSKKAPPPVPTKP